MIEKLATNAELLAQNAERLPAFSGFQLLHVKRQLSELLSLIGRDGIFDQYTKHDISHIDSMLKSLDWLIPPDTHSLMTAADWMMTVLAIYFHDLGMLVTGEEYKKRNASGFIEFRDQVLFAGSEGQDYRSKVETLSQDEAARFLYQEFVRYKHAERIRNWIIGRAPEHLGLSNPVMNEVDKLLRNLHPQFRRDLALVSESHHLEDLGDLKKYRISQPYGNSIDESCNVQYCALLLRTADLLHMTGDRVPSILFRVINPADPISQIEWSKQMAVTSVRPRLGVDREGMPNAEVSRDTIEVHAYFTDAKGFFGLSSYLSYAEEQLRRTNEWSKVATRQGGARYNFPWRFIDDAGVEAAGFLRQQFEFTIDQAKILDLLTGHTLYNDTQVVIRELVQNSIDAIKLQRVLDEMGGRPITAGLISIVWDPDTRELSIRDNGTGMTQDIIERHLLKVGASRYQDPDFKHQFPNFSAISRFGIGLLSVFMIADDVEIFTVHPDEIDARQLSLRSVHGKYLIMLHDKGSDSVRDIGAHGTLVRLRVRQSADMKDLLETCKKWIVVPQCDVYVRSGLGDTVKVGFDSLREALAEVLEFLEPEIGGPLKVEEQTVDGVTVVYLVKWSEFFREWSFVGLERNPTGELAGKLGICVEGVRVEFGTPGFAGGVVAIANAVGVQAPKTNVARSGLEATPQRDTLLRAIYQAYCSHVIKEAKELEERRSFSLTWAVQEIGYLVNPLLGRSGPTNSEILSSVLKDVPALLVERDGRRNAVSPSQLNQEELFWTIESAFFQSAELLMREVQGSASLSGLVKGLGVAGMEVPREALLCSRSLDEFDRSLFSMREADVIRIDRLQRRVDLRWVKIGDQPRWIVLNDYEVVRPREYDSYYDFQSARMRGRQYSILVGSSDVEVFGATGETAVKVKNRLFIFPDTAAAQYIITILDQVPVADRADLRDFLANVIMGRHMFLEDDPESLDALNEFIEAAEVSEAVRRMIKGDQLMSSLLNNLDVFDPSNWSRGLE